MGSVAEVKQKKLSKEQLYRLEKIGFVWDVLSTAWEEGFKTLEAYEDKHGDCLVPRNYQTSSGFLLGDWVHKQRNRRNKLSKERQTYLETLGFVWNPHDVKWEKGFKALVTYKESYGDTLVPVKHQTSNGFKLGSWVNTQRNKGAYINTERKSRLDALGFVWNVLSESWEKGFNALEKYKEEYGDCLVAQRYVTSSGFALGRWVAKQRAHKNKLDPENKSRLYAIGFVWRVRE